jgi:RecJ-like exonuclease
MQGIHGVSRTCKHCNKIFKVSPKMVQKIQEAGYELPVRCKTCNGKKYEGRLLKCHSCHGTFQFTQLDEETLRKIHGKSYHDPLYCKKCRSEWKKQNNM